MQRFQNWLAQWVKTPAGLLSAALILGVIAIMAFSPGKAKAADKGGPQLPVISDAPYDKKPNWTGFYVGGNVGAVAGVMDPIFGVDGIQWGAEAGFIVQMGRVLAGVGVSYDWKTVEAFGSSVDAKQWAPYGKLGFLITDHTALYGKISRPTLILNGSDTEGFGVGGGMQTMFAKNWSLALEYERDTFKDIPNATEHVGTLRLNYHIPANFLSGGK